MDRRKFVTAAGGFLLAGAAPLRALGQDNAGMALTGEGALPNLACRETRRQTPGPYPNVDSPLRADIREGVPGVPLRLRLKVRDAIGCGPIGGARVELWQSDAAGVYSNAENIAFDRETLRPAGVFADTRGQSFLRGHQTGGEDGALEFVTIFPGWYYGRVPHIHVRVVYGGMDWTRHDTQLYLPADIEREVYDRAPYAERGQNPLPAHRDLALKDDDAMRAELTVPLARDGEGFKGEFELFV